jgi:DNA-binding MarR family transcriptional regulator
MASSDPLRDSVDKVIDDWRELRPDLDASPVGVVARLRRVRSRFDHELEALFAEHDLTVADFEVLATLRRLGGATSQRQLMDALGLTSGTVSVRIDRLVAAGLVTRDPDPQDGRGALVTLTPKGHTRFDQTAPAHLANEDRLLGALDSDERAQLADLLRKLLLSFEGAHEPRGSVSRSRRPTSLAGCDERSDCPTGPGCSSRTSTSVARRRALGCATATCSFAPGGARCIRSRSFRLRSRGQSAR